MNRTIIMDLNTPRSQQMQMMLNLNNGNPDIYGTKIINLQAPRMEGYTPYAGPRESCEDIICAPCNQYANNQSWDQYKQCKQKCFENQKEAITTCCLNFCGSNNPECVKACNTVLIYGPSAMMNRNKYVPSQGQLLNL